MKNLQKRGALCWELNGGLGNQIFQLWAAHTVNRELGLCDDITVYESEYLKKGYRLPIALELVKGIEETCPKKGGAIDRMLGRMLRYTDRLGLDYFDKTRYVMKGIGINENDVQNDKWGGSALENLLGWLKKTGSYREKEVCVSGYWQEAKVLLEHRVSFRNRLRTSQGTRRQEDYIAIHVRRSDYLEGAAAREYRSRGSTWSHIRASLDMMPEWTLSLPVIICSDDQEWAARMAEGCVWRGRTVTSSRNNEREDWELMRNAIVLVGSNSTYSASAALLSNRYEEPRFIAYLPGWYNEDVLASEKGWIVDSKIYDTL